MEAEGADKRFHQVLLGALYLEQLDETARTLIRESKHLAEFENVLQPTPHSLAGNAGPVQSGLEKIKQTCGYIHGVTLKRIFSGFCKAQNSPIDENEFASYTVNKLQSLCTLLRHECKIRNTRIPRNNLHHAKNVIGRATDCEPVAIDPSQVPNIQSDHNYSSASAQVYGSPTTIPVTSEAAGNSEEIDQETSASHVESARETPGGAAPETAQTVSPSREHSEHSSRKRAANPPKKHSHPGPVVSGPLYPQVFTEHATEIASMANEEGQLSEEALEKFIGELLFDLNDGHAPTITSNQVQNVVSDEQPLRNEEHLLETGERSGTLHTPPRWGEGEDSNLPPGHGPFDGPTDFSSLSQSLQGGFSGIKSAEKSLVSFEPAAEVGRCVQDRNANERIVAQKKPGPVAATELPVILGEHASQAQVAEISNGAAESSTNFVVQKSVPSENAGTSSPQNVVAGPRKNNKRKRSPSRKRLENDDRKRARPQAKAEVREKRTKPLKPIEAVPKNFLFSKDSKTSTAKQPAKSKAKTPQAASKPKQQEKSKTKTEKAGKRDKAKQKKNSGKSQSLLTEEERFEQVIVSVAAEAAKEEKRQKRLQKVEEKQRNELEKRQAAEEGRPALIKTNIGTPTPSTSSDEDEVLSLIRDREVRRKTIEQHGLAFLPEEQVRLVLRAATEARLSAEKQEQSARATVAVEPEVPKRSPEAASTSETSSHSKGPKKSRTRSSGSAKNKKDGTQEGKGAEQKKSRKKEQKETSREEQDASERLFGDSNLFQTEKTPKKDSTDAPGVSGRKASEKSRKKQGANKPDSGIGPQSAKENGGLRVRKGGGADKLTEPHAAGTAGLEPNIPPQIGVQELRGGCVQSVLNGAEGDGGNVADDISEGNSNSSFVTVDTIASEKSLPEELENEESETPAPAAEYEEGSFLDPNAPFLPDMSPSPLKRPQHVTPAKSVARTLDLTLGSEDKRVFEATSTPIGSSSTNVEKSVIIQDTIVEEDEEDELEKLEDSSISGEEAQKDEEELEEEGGEWKLQLELNEATSDEELRNEGQEEQRNAEVVNLVDWEENEIVEQSEEPQKNEEAQSNSEQGIEEEQLKNGELESLEPAGEIAEEEKRTANEDVREKQEAGKIGEVLENGVGEEMEEENEKDLAVEEGALKDSTEHSGRSQLDFLLGFVAAQNKKPQENGEVGESSARVEEISAINRSNEENVGDSFLCNLNRVLAKDIRKKKRKSDSPKKKPRKERKKEKGEGGEPGRKKKKKRKKGEVSHPDPSSTNLQNGEVLGEEPALRILSLSGREACESDTIEDLNAELSSLSDRSRHLVIHESYLDKSGKLSLDGTGVGSVVPGRPECSGVANEIVQKGMESLDSDSRASVESGECTPSPVVSPGGSPLKDTKRMPKDKRKTVLNKLHGGRRK